MKKKLFSFLLALAGLAAIGIGIYWIIFLLLIQMAIGKLRLYNSATNGIIFFAFVNCIWNEWHRRGMKA